MVVLINMNGFKYQHHNVMLRNFKPSHTDKTEHKASRPNLVNDIICF